MWNAGLRKPGGPSGWIAAAAAAEMSGATGGRTAARTLARRGARAGGAEPRGEVFVRGHVPERVSAPDPGQPTSPATPRLPRRPPRPPRTPGPTWPFPRTTPHSAPRPGGRKPWPDFTVPQCGRHAFAGIDTCRPAQGPPTGRTRPGTGPRGSHPRATHARSHRRAEQARPGGRVAAGDRAAARAARARRRGLDACRRRPPAQARRGGRAPGPGRGGSGAAAGRAPARQRAGRMRPAARDPRAGRQLCERRRAASVLSDVCNPAGLVVTGSAGVLREGRAEGIRGAALELVRVRDGPARIAVPRAGAAGLPGAAATVLLSRVFQDPVGTLREGEITPAGMVPPERAPLHSSHDGPA